MTPFHLMSCTNISLLMCKDTWLLSRWCHTLTYNPSFAKTYDSIYIMSCTNISLLTCKDIWLYFMWCDALKYHSSCAKTHDSISRWCHALNWAENPRRHSLGLLLNLLRTATRCNILQHTTIHWNTLHGNSLASDWHSREREREREREIEGEKTRERERERKRERSR